jgi:putative Holliday junction resolvase
MARYLGIDLGSKRIGVSRSDPSGTIASPLKTLSTKGDEADIAALIALLHEEEAEGFVIGLPVLLNGKHGGMAAKIKAFAKRLNAASGRSVEFWDERLSTVAAERALLEANLRREKRRDLIDAVAAALILQSWLNAKSGPRDSEEYEPQ